MKKFEYEYLTECQGKGNDGWYSRWELGFDALDSKGLLDALNTVGKKGWEVVVKQSDGCYLMKREIESNDDLK